MEKFVTHYNGERNHHGNVFIRPDPAQPAHHGPLRCRRRLGGMLNYYHRAA
jgi:hypothetical protein